MRGDFFVKPQMKPKVVREMLKPNRSVTLSTKVAHWKRQSTKTVYFGEQNKYYHKQNPKMKI